MPKSLDHQLEDIGEKRGEILKKIEERNARKMIKCASCDKPHQIRTLKSIQTHWYTSPHGCTGGDDWNEGELQFICPETGVRNRLLFDNDDVPWEERKDYENDPEAQFRVKYKKLFREVKDEYDKEESYEFENNHYVDENRKRFGLVEKRK